MLRLDADGPFAGAGPAMDSPAIHEGFIGCRDGDLKGVHSAQPNLPDFSRASSTVPTM